MIRLGFDVAVAVFLSIVVLFILGAWLFDRKRRERQSGVEDDKGRDMRQCPYCRHICVDDKHQKIMICPVCRSYFDEEVS